MEIKYIVIPCLFLCVFCFCLSRLFRKLKGLEEIPMSSENNTPQIKYDAFVSFRGEDIRSGFLSHLIDTFQRKKINAFVDDKNLKKGEEIWSKLVEAIEGSSIFLIIFSPGYASSRWCLEELVKILECKEKHGRIVIPVFYHVEPSHVRHQLRSYKTALAKHERKHKTKVHLWKSVLNKSADLSGIDSSKFQNEAELIKEIVNLLLSKLAEPHVNSKGLVGINEKIAIVESMIRKHKEPKDVCLIGIWAMGGIGKTTLAEEVFNKFQYEYEGCYFLANEREQSSRHGILPLKNEIFSELLEDDVKIKTLDSLPDDIVRRIGRMKVFIVLDDVNDSDHLQNLLGTLDNYGSGSRIIVTTRDEQVLNANKADEIYRLTELSSSEALQFFNLNAFNKSDLHKEYNELSKKVVNYAKGVPLVLKVLARLLCGKNKEVWESELSKLEKIPPTKVYDKMKLSFDDLDRKEKQIFLDLACFFLKLSTKINVDNLKSLLKDDKSDNSVIFGLERLKDKALISFSEDNLVSMHDSLQEMAYEIVRQESIEDPGSRSRLWDPNGIYEVLKNDKVTEAIRSIRIQLTSIRGLKLRPHIFAKMSILKFLEISREDAYGFEDQLGEGPLFLATELRFLSWDCYPLKSLPQNFSAEKLVILKLQLSKLEKLWDGVKNLVSLKGVYLQQSYELKELPDLSKAINLEVLDLSTCTRLTTVHPSIFSLAKLEKLNLSNCISLTILSSDSHMHSLNYLILDCCKNLTEFSIISKNMEKLDLSWTFEMKALPSSFGHQRKLKSLDLTESGIQRLPSSINNLTQLLHLNLSYCRKLKTIPELPPSLETLDAQCCSSLQTLPMLPLSLKNINARDCKSLKTILLLPSTSVEQLRANRTRVLLWNCLNLDQHSLVAIELNAQISVMNFANQHLSVEQSGEKRTPLLLFNHLDFDEYSPVVYVYPGRCVPEWLEYKTTNNYVIIDLSSTPSSPMLNFIFGFVLGKYVVTARKNELTVKITLSDGDGEGERDSVEMLIDDWLWTIESNHVCVMYDRRCSNFLNSRAQNQTSLKIQAQIELKLHLYDIWLDHGYGLPEHMKNTTVMQPDMVLGFGVSAITSSTYNNFIQQMSMSQFH